MILSSSSYYFGYYLSIFNPLATPLLKDVFGLSNDTKPTFDSVQGNIHSFPAFVAFLTLMFLQAPLTRYFGRLRTVFLGEFLALLTAFAFVMLDQFESLSSKIYWLEGIRLVSGVVLAINTIVAQLILSETLHDGWLEVGSFLTFVFLGGGTFVAFAIGRIYSEEELVKYWKFILAGPCFFSILRIAGLYFVWMYRSQGASKPGVLSVKWILEKYWDKEVTEESAPGITNDQFYREKARKEVERLLTNLYTCDNVDLKIKELIADYESQNSKSEGISLRSFIVGRYARSFYIALFINIGMKCSGCDFMTFFSTDFFNDINGEGSKITFYMGGVQVLSALVGIFILNKLGRRPLLVWGGFFQGVSMFILFFFIQAELNDLMIYPVLLFNIAFVLGLGGLNLVYTTEIVSPKVVGICASTQYLTTSIIGKVTPILLKKFSNASMMLTYGVLCMVVTVIGALYFVETQGKTEIEVNREIMQMGCGGVVFADK